MREVTLTLTVRVPDSVLAENVAQQVGDKIGPDGWNWEVSYPDVTGERMLRLLCTECGEEAWTDIYGIAHHWGDGIDDIDHDADADHVALPEWTE
jgi:hypothetical protein